MEVVPWNERSSSANAPEFIGVFADWKKQVMGSRGASRLLRPSIDFTGMTLVQWLSMLKPAQPWSILSALAVVVGGAFSLGAKLLGEP